MWTLRHLSLRNFDNFEYWTSLRNSFSVTPNLSLSLPVEICFSVFAFVLGFNLIPILTFFFFIFPIFSITKSSLLDSTLINKTFLFIAYSNSEYVLPTPEKTIFFGLTPAFKAFIISPLDTTSAPQSKFLISFIIFTFELDLTEKQIKGPILLKWFLKLIILFFNFK